MQNIPSTTSADLTTKPRKTRGTARADHTRHLPCHTKLCCTCHTVSRKRTSNKKRRKELHTLYRLHQTDGQRTEANHRTTQEKHPETQADHRQKQTSHPKETSEPHGDTSETSGDTSEAPTNKYYSLSRARTHTRTKTKTLWLESEDLRAFLGKGDEPKLGNVYTPEN